MRKQTRQNKQEETWPTVKWNCLKLGMMKFKNLLKLSSTSKKIKFKKLLDIISHFPVGVQCFYVRYDWFIAISHNCQLVLKSKKNVGIFVE